MGLLFESFNSANKSRYYLNRNSELLTQSLLRLSSGSKLVGNHRDAGGIAVAARLSAEIGRTNATASNVANASSFASSQSSSLETVSDILTQMSELRSQYDSATATSTEKSNYNVEFQSLRAELANIQQTTFNGTSFYATSSDSVFGFTPSIANVALAVQTSQAGSATTTTVSVQKLALETSVWVQGAAAAGTATAGGTYSAADSLAGTSNNTASLGTFSVADITQAINNVSSLRAENAAVTSRLSFAQSHLENLSTGLSSAYSTVNDVDIAEETSLQSKLNILIQGGTAAIAQANTQAATVLTLLDGIKSLPRLG